MMQSQENDHNPHFGPNFDHLSPFSRIKFVALNPLSSANLMQKVRKVMGSRKSCVTEDRHKKTMAPTKLIT